MEVAEDSKFKAVDFRRPSSVENSIEQAAEMIKKAKQPLLLIGASANHQRAIKALPGFVDTIGFPINKKQFYK